VQSKTKIWVGIISGLVVMVILLVGVKGGQIVTMIEAGAAFAPPPEAVSAATVERVEWVGTRTAVGSLVADRGVTLSVELPGTVRQISFQAGSSVSPGQVLARLDTTTEEAQLAASRAEASLARQDLERARILRETETNTRADLDAAEARGAAAEAQVATLEATIAKKTIRAPFAGRISIRQVELGQYVAPGQPIASLQSVSPIHAEFSIPQQALTGVRPGLETSLRIDAFPGSSWKGTVTIVNPEVDVATRTVRVRATFENRDGRLRPGMFANVEIFSPETSPTLLIPATAVLYAPYGDSVFALEEKKDEATGQTATVARQKFVRLGDRRGDFVAVVSGVEAGETVVSAGAFKLRNGMSVAVLPDLAPDAKLAPTPKDQ
jgi:membrane fusion protein (multidrug efflux system)